MKGPSNRARPQRSPREHFDAIVIGSGFGGSVMAHRLAAAGKRVCLLERGKAYPPGSFARTAREIANNFWDPKGRRRGPLDFWRPKQYHQGLFDVWSFNDTEAVVSAGLGGGSLIYANVLIRKDRNWFVQHGGRSDGYEDWPLTYEDLEENYVAVEAILKPEVYPAEYRRDNKTAAMEAAAQARQIPLTTWDNVNPQIPQLYHPQLAVTFRAANGRPSIGHVFDDGSGNMHRQPRETCRLCGECDVGCNYGAKNTLDYNYLTLAKRNGADIRTLSEAETIVPRRSGHGSSYEVSYTQHADGGDPAARRTRTISADRVVVACGTLGSQLLLMRNRHHLPKLSAMLGKRFCGNGDFLAFAVRATKKSPGRKREPRRLNASRAPVITSTFRFPDRLDGDETCGRGGYLQDAGYPVLGDYLWELMHPFADLERLLRFGGKWLAARLVHGNSEIGPQLTRLLGDGEMSSCSMPLLGIGRDVPNGRARLDRKGRLQISWPDLPSKPYYRRIDQEARATAKRFGAKYDENPLKRIFNRLITVHPLGGCPMGHSRRDGVVDSFGEVFGHPGLYVADGSVMPGPVGANPSLTIAALSDRFATQMLKTWDRR